MQTNADPQDLWFDLETLINVAQPSSVALFGEFPEDFLADYEEQYAVLGKELLRHHIIDTQTAETFSIPADVAVVANLIEHMSKAKATRLISRLRDVLSDQFCLCLPICDHPQSGWTLTELLALGLLRVGYYQHNQQQIGLFKYRLQDYKKTPEWLNAENWANPHLWGKYFW